MMAGPTPQFNMGETVYSRESAAIGFLEVFVIASIYQPSPSRMVYFMRSSPSEPSQTATFGDRLNLQYRSNLYFEEDELVTYCEAVDLATLDAERKLAGLVALQNSCPTTE